MENNKVKFIFSSPLDFGFAIKSLEPGQLSGIILILRENFKKLSSFRLSSYIKLLIRLLISEDNTLKLLEDKIAEVPTTPDDLPIYIWESIYVQICEIYPQLDIKFVTSNFNDYITFQKSILEQYGVRQNNVDESPIRNMAVAPQKKKTIVEKKVFNNSHIIELERKLNANVIGQEKAISSLIDTIKSICVGFTKRASFMFLGPTGVGKTKLANVFGKDFVDGNVFKIDCGEYANGHEYNKLIGAPPGYVGSDHGNILKALSDKSNRWVIIFDEIEKAHGKFYNFLLSLIDEGVITDNQGNKLDFTESIFIFTTNCGLSTVKTNMISMSKNINQAYDTSHDQILQEVNKVFPAEFRNRIDNLIFFNSLTPEMLKEIATLELSYLPLRPDDKVINFIVENSYSPEYGARELNRFIRKNITVILADVILNGYVPKDGGIIYQGDIIDGKFVVLEVEQNVIEKQTQNPVGKTSTKQTKTTKATRTRRDKK